MIFQHQKNINRHLKKANQQITQQNLEQRLIAINELEKIVVEHPEECNSVIQIIANFIKQNRSIQILNYCEVNPIREINIDIQIALKIITNPDYDEYLCRDKIDLSCIDIRGASFCGANLKKINLQQSILNRVNFTDATLEKANLKGAVLTTANFENANLASCNLSGAILNAANLSGANLEHADLTCANLFLANLQGADLKGINFDGANLRDAYFCGNRATTAG